MCTSGPKLTPPPAPPPPPPAAPEPTAQKLGVDQRLLDAQRTAGRLGTSQLRIPIDTVNVPA